MVQTPYFAANQPVLRGFWSLTLQNRGFGLQTPCFAQPCPLWGGLEGVGNCCGTDRMSVRKMPLKPHEWPFKFPKWVFRAFKRRSLRGWEL